MLARERVFVALDFNDRDRALRLAESLAGDAGGFKIGMRLFYSAGPQVIEEVASLGRPVFLDLKLHDIPQTVASAVRALVHLRAAIINVHASGGMEMLRAAVAAAAEESAARGLPRAKIIAVTVLTSLSDADLGDLGVTGGATEVVLRWAGLARQAGLDGIVASAREALAIRQQFGSEFMVVTPGIRLPEDAEHDHARVTTPGAAVRDGADYLVIGRPITGADNPLAALRKVIHDIEISDKGGDLRAW